MHKKDTIFYNNKPTHLKELVLCSSLQSKFLRICNYKDFWTFTKVTNNLIKQFCQKHTKYFLGNTLLIFSYIISNLLNFFTVRDLRYMIYTSEIRFLLKNIVPLLITSNKLFINIVPLLITSNKLFTIQKYVF